VTVQAMQLSIAYCSLRLTIPVNAVLVQHCSSTHALKSCVGHLQLVQAFQEGPLSFLLHVVIDGSEGVSMLSSKHQHLEQLTMLCQKSFLFYRHKVDNSSKFKAHLLPPRKAMLTPLGTARATTCA